MFAFAENRPDEEDDLLSTRTVSYQNACVPGVKIMSASGDTPYQIKMENAALIRFNRRRMREQVAFAVLEDKADAEHKKMIEESLDKCKALFGQRVATFKRDEYEDEWGLF